MMERIIVFVNPPQYGQLIPELYDIQIFNASENKIEIIVDVLENLGFTSVRQVGQSEKGSSYRKPDILAEYFVGGEKVEYDCFWDKKEKVELVLEG
ncbi:MAG: hypothetical protein JSV25_12555 [Spirochaetota bacterium]|nr:MAG: hypothetical protein JSV25_12555 [Spirochaetota bacterium]